MWQSFQRNKEYLSLFTHKMRQTDERMMVIREDPGIRLDVLYTLWSYISQTRR